MAFLDCCINFVGRFIYSYGDSIVYLTTIIVDTVTLYWWSSPLKGAINKISNFVILGFGVGSPEPIHWLGVREILPFAQKPWEAHSWRLVMFLMYLVLFYAPSTLLQLKFGWGSICH